MHPRSKKPVSKADPPTLRKPSSSRNSALAPLRLIERPEPEKYDQITADRLAAMSEAMRPTPGGLVPDWPTRLSALKLILAYTFGLPVARKEAPEQSKATDEEVSNSLRRNPSYRQAFRDYLDFIDREEAAKNLADSESPNINPTQDQTHTP